MRQPAKASLARRNVADFADGTNEQRDLFLVSRTVRILTFSKNFGTSGTCFSRIGDQIYACRAESAQFQWTLKAPEAQLFSKDGKPFGKHFAGPSWQANDGSRITGKAAANAPSSDADSIPWLLVTVASRSGEGVLARVTSIQRLNTKGGKASTSGCDNAHLGQESRVPYSADYLFFASK